MSRIDRDVWHMAVENPDALSQTAWKQLEQTLAADPALRQRLVAERRLHERLSRLHDVGRGDLGAALRHRLTHAVDHPRFVRRVVRRTAARRHQVRHGSRWWSSSSTWIAAAMLVVAVGAGWWWRPAAQARWIDGPATIALSGGGSAELDREARMRDGDAPFLERGRVTFEVAHRSAAPFSVRTPQATITVLGTQFSVRVGEDTIVAVQRGLVRLEDAAGTAVELAAGQRGRCAAGAVQRERVHFSSGFAPGEPSSILVGHASPLDPDGQADPCVAAGSFPSDNGPRVCVAVGNHLGGLVRHEPAMRINFRWWAEPAVGSVTLLVWDEEQQINFVLELGVADGQWQQVNVPIAQLHPIAGSPRMDLRPAAGDHLQGALVVGSRETGRLYMDDLVFSVSE